ncbi:stage II sporulation protein P [Cohnella thailandensis]|uniref:Stage II sporulation protein P n=1 Tax=Cohnella thailandensis TaxID=557557 RepID=A0A841T0W6_9BACL|nr:stage II sporulation protein P [Cohnella thailandensis]MBB6636195.1 stage II sporulation protein P [Cohnella thailandensis]MBP1973836.1 stage II sporulation protein P [Cohnella thailandensis]
MKRIVVVRRKRPGRHLRRILSTGKAFLLLSFSSMLVFLMLGLGGMLQNTLSSSPIQTMKGFAASLSSDLFSSLLGMELPHMAKQEDSDAFSAQRMAAFLVRFLTDLNPNDPKSLLELGMPGVAQDKAVLLRPGSGGNADDAPLDHAPEIQTEDAPGVEPDGEETGEPSEPPASEAPPPPGDPAGTPAPEDGTEAPDSGETEGRKVVFVYHSHNRESFYPELKAGTKQPDSGAVNVTLVGKRLVGQLEKLGVGAVHSNDDYAKTIKDYNWNNSYKYSLQTVKEAMADNKDLQIFFDIHRDSQRRSKTTTTINGVDYAQVYFIIGHRNPNWEENEKFANSIHQVLEKEYPGLSRGIWGKDSTTGNGEYNQSVSPDSVLIEIGGVDNTLAECYRTADALAKVVAELYWERQDAVQVSGRAADTSKQ